MKLEKMPIRVKCDNGCCGNYAEFQVVRQGTPAAARLRLCRSCLKELSSLYGELPSTEVTDVGTNMGNGD